MTVYYNEFDNHAAEWLRNLISEGLIADGDVDNRPIQEVTPSDLQGYTQCHFFAGIGGWSYALRLAGWSDERPVWTGSCPCQSFSVAGKKRGASDSERHLWPEWFRLIEKCSPPTVFGEQVAGAIGFGWLDAVATDFESQDYAFASAVLSGFTVGAYHKRQRLWFVADSTNDGRSKVQSDPKSRGIEGSEEERRLFESKGERSHMAHTKNHGRRRRATTVERKGSKNLKDESEFDLWSKSSRHGKVVDNMPDTQRTRLQKRLRGRSVEERQSVNRHVRRCNAVDWEAVEWVKCKDGKTRPIPLESEVQPLVDGLPTVLDREGNSHKWSYANTLTGIGNTIIPAVAAEFILSFTEVTSESIK
tara:strand:+ start:19 stop:1101 length:1083 start_codon:yes stop_codon:yes gene_type:complete